MAIRAPDGAKNNDKYEKNIDKYKKRGGHLPTKQSRRLTLPHTQIPPNNVICQKKPPMKDVKRYIHFSDGRGEGERGGTGEGGGCVGAVGGGMCAGAASLVIIIITSVIIIIITIVIVITFIMI